MVTIYVSGILILYLFLILIFWVGWEKIKIEHPNELFKPRVSIIVAVRNEEKNITRLLSDLVAQEYPSDKMEVVLIDDHSDDGTCNRINEFIEATGERIRLIELESGIGKKFAIKYGVETATGTIILTTDGDCSLGPSWVSSMIAAFENKVVKLISGPVKLHPASSLFQRLQSIEFSALISSGAATIAFGLPTMANAANMAFRKDTFLKTKSSGNTLSSGDDVFLLHAVGKNSSAVTFCQDEKAIVSTLPAETFSEFYNQRKRWAGKWTAYQSKAATTLALFIFLVNLVTFSLLFLVWLNIISAQVAINLFLAKSFFEYWFLRDVQKFFKTRFLLYEFLILAIIYPVYVIFTAISGTVSGYRWKDRQTR